MLSITENCQHYIENCEFMIEKEKCYQFGVVGSLIYYRDKDMLRVLCDWNVNVFQRHSNLNIQLGDLMVHALRRPGVC